MPEIEARMTEQADGGLSVESPLVGIWSQLPSKGAILSSRGGIGQIQVGSKRYNVRVPFGTQGRVSLIHGDGDYEVAVEWGQELIRLEPLSVDGTRAEDPSTESTAGSKLQYRSPTDGIFYGRPAPDSPPFVEVGATIEQGTPVGLVEVMKTFNQILFEDAALPSSVTVVRCLVKDGAEVQAGDPLFDLAPA